LKEIRKHHHTANHVWLWPGNWVYDVTIGLNDDAERQQFPPENANLMANKSFEVTNVPCGSGAYFWRQTN